MNPRTTGILLLVAAVLGAFLWLYELEGETARRESEEAARRLFPGFESEDVEWIALRSDDGTDARFERREAGWWMVEPVDFPAASAVERMADALASLTHEATFEEPAPDAEYGLDEASAHRVRFGAGGEEHALRLGRETPVGSNRYARTDDSDAVYTVASYRTTAFDGAVDDWRDRQVLDFDVAAVEELEASWPGGGVVARRTPEADASGEEEGAEAGPAWRLTSPLEAAGDVDAIEDLLSTLSFLQADGFLDAPDDETLAMLDPPDWSVALRLEGDAERRLELSRPDPAGRRWARVAGRAPLFELPADRIEDFPRRVVAYRDRSLARFPVTEAAHVDLFYRAPEGDPVVIRARKDLEGWSAEPEEFAPGALSRLVSALSRLEADDVLAESMSPDELESAGLAPPEAVISVFAEAPESGEGEEPVSPRRLAEVHLGHASPDGIVARRAGADTIFRLDIETAERIPVSLEAFRSRFRADAEPAEAAGGPLEDPLAPPSAAEESP